LRTRRYIKPRAIPSMTPKISAIQSLRSALRLNVGCMNSINPPNALAPMKMSKRLTRLVRARGKARAANATRCTSLSLPLGVGGDWSIGQSIATVRMSVTMSVRGISKYFRICGVYLGVQLMASTARISNVSNLSRKVRVISCLGLSIM
jgi:hypothetical protein